MVSFSSGVVESPARYMAGLGALVQWYPGHIAKAEKALKDQSKVVDMLIGTRDARLSLATCLPQPCSAAVPTCKKEKSSNLTSIARATVKGVEGAVESPVRYMGASGPLVQWYPGHIAKAEKALKDQLKMVDVVIEVRDARIPLATCHPEIDFWIGEKTKIVVLNREDMISTADKNAWGNYFANCGISPIFTDSRFGSGTMKVVRTSKSVATAINARRQAKGLLPRAVRAAVVGYPNVGKSSLINRILRRRKCEVAPKPGVTRVLKWVRLGEDLDLLDSPGILPMRIDDQTAAVHLAICNDIGEASYATEGVAAYLVEILKQMPTAGSQVLSERYKMEAENLSGQMFLEELGQKLFAGDLNQAAYRVLRDFRKGSFGSIALELPPNSSRDS